MHHDLAWMIISTYKLDRNTIYAICQNNAIVNNVLELVLVGIVLPVFACIHLTLIGCKKKGFQLHIAVPKIVYKYCRS